MLRFSSPPFRRFAGALFTGALLAGALLALAPLAGPAAWAQSAASDGEAVRSGSDASPSRSPVHWGVHSTERPLPPVVDPGPAPDAPAPVPADATVLFDGSSLDAWEQPDGSAPEWTVADGILQVEPGSGPIRTREGFGDVQLHVEWRVPESVEGSGQNYGNSGLYLMGTYEIQILNTYQNETYADGHAAAVYGQYPPLVNASRPPGSWQTYDIVFHRPHFDENGVVVEPARFTVFHNGVLVQEGVELTGPTAYQERPPYEPHASKLPLRIQDHGSPVQFRSIWLRELE
jgi:hypothetical protein